MVKTLVTGLRPLRMAARGSQFGKPAHPQINSGRSFLSTVVENARLPVCFFLWGGHFGT